MKQTNNATFNVGIPQPDKPLRDRSTPTPEALERGRIRRRIEQQEEILRLRREQREQWWRDEGPAEGRRGGNR